MRFEWDEAKAARNLAKHGVSFEEAATVVDDPFYVRYNDPDHSVEEDRFIIIGESNRRRLLLIACTDRFLSTRIISARKVTPRERFLYEESQAY